MSKGHKLNQIIAFNIRKCRLERHINKVELAKCLGIHYATYIKIEKADKLIRAEELFVISNFFNIPIEDFFEIMD